MHDSCRVMWMHVDAFMHIYALTDLDDESLLGFPLHSS